jgi:hypothetical protein
MIAHDQEQQKARAVFILNACEGTGQIHYSIRDLSTREHHCCSVECLMSLMQQTLAAAKRKEAILKRLHAKTKD